MKKLLIFIYFLSLLLPFSAKAESKYVIINEIMWMGSSASTADEWLELKNTTNQTIDLSNFSIEGAGASGSTIQIFDGIIGPHDYFLISNYNKDENTILDIEPDMIEKNISLSNSSLKLVLKDANGVVVDEAWDGSEPTRGVNLDGQKASMQRVDNPDDGTKSIDWQIIVAEQKNIKQGFYELATPQSSINASTVDIKNAKIIKNKVKISGLVTTKADLFLDSRLYIQDGTAGIRVKLKYGDWLTFIKVGQRLTLTGFIDEYYTEKELVIIDDSEIKVGSEELLAPFVIKTGDYQNYEGAFVKVIGKITQTSGDTFYMDDGSGEVKIYVKENLGITLPDKRVGDSAEITGILNNWNGGFRLLPREQNDIKITSSKKIEAIKVLPISEAKKQTIGTKVITYGRVSVEPGRLGKTIFYIQDDYSGIQIYSWYKDFPLLRLGDLIEVIGEISETGGEIRIKIKLASDIRVLESGRSPTPQKIFIKQVNNYLGRLVRIKGTITKSSGNTFYINDGTGTIKIYIKKETGIKKPRLKKGDIVEITGIVSVTESGLRIMPRYQNDFKLVWIKPKKGKVLKASTYKRPELNKEETILEAKKVPAENNLLYLAYGGLFLLGSSILLLKNVNLDK